MNVDQINIFLESVPKDIIQLFTNEDGTIQLYNLLIYWWSQTKGNTLC